MNLAWLTRGAASAERARRLMELRGVTPNGHPLWRPWEVDIVVFGNRNYRAIFPRLDRTKPAIYNKASRLGATKPRSPPWSDNEILRLRRVYPTGTRAEIEGAFPGRTYCAVANAANSRGIRRAPKPSQPTGDRVLDQILTRAKERNVSRAELDAEAGGGRKYFAEAKWRRLGFSPKCHAHAVAFLGGNLRAEWTANSVVPIA